MQKFLIVPLLILLLHSCAIEIKGLHNDYQKLSATEKESVIFVPKDSTICGFSNDQNIYAISGNQLKDCLAKNDTSLLYRWGPNCSSSNCNLIEACQEFCDQNNYQLYVLADYYDMEKMEAQNKSDFPILIANHRIYRKNFSNKINRLFLNDVFDLESLEKEEKYARFHFFKGEEWIGARHNLFEE